MLKGTYRFYSNMCSHVQYLGLTPDNKPTSDRHMADIHKRSQQRLTSEPYPPPLTSSSCSIQALSSPSVDSPCFFTVLTGRNRNKRIRIIHTLRLWSYLEGVGVCSVFRFSVMQMGVCRSPAAIGRLLAEAAKMAEDPGFYHSPSSSLFC